jgi:hypothetical protein
MNIASAALGAEVALNILQSFAGVGPNSGLDRSYLCYATSLLCGLESEAVHGSVFGPIV